MTRSSAPLTRSQAITKIFMLTLKYGTLWGAIGGAGFGTFLMPVVGTLIGLVDGALVGFAVGMANMVVISVLTVRVFYPLCDRIAYTRTIQCITISTTFITSFVAFALIFSSSGDGSIVARIFQASPLIYLPVSIASVFAWFGAQRVITWYLDNAPVEPCAPQHAMRQRRCFMIVGITLIALGVGWVAFQILIMRGDTTFG